MKIPEIKAPTSLYKWIWFVTVLVPLALLRISEKARIDVQNKLDRCEQSKADLGELKRKSDSAVIYRLMDEAFRHSKDNIITPVVDSVKNNNL